MYLDLSQNIFSTSSIPTTYGLLSNLKYLNLNFCKINGNLPSSIAMLSKLQYLDFSINKFRGTIPTNINSLISLKQIYLYRNSMTGVIPSTFCSISGLTYAAFDSNSFSCYSPCLTSIAYLFKDTSVSPCLATTSTSTPTTQPSTGVNYISHSLHLLHLFQN